MNVAVDFEILSFVDMTSISLVLILGIDVKLKTVQFYCHSLDFRIV